MSPTSPNPRELPCEVIPVSGLNFAAITEASLIEYVISEALQSRGGRIVTANLDFLQKTSRSDDLKSLVNQADIIVADGTPVLWAAKLAGTPLPERVTGSDLLFSLTAAALDASLPIALLGGDDDLALQQAINKLSRPQGRLTGYSPPLGFETDDAAQGKIRSLLDEQSTKIVFVGLGFPKQEHLIALLRSEFPQHWYVGVGASINFAAERVSRAPKWMQEHGLEWFYRLCVEPRRLFRRYIIEDIPFLVQLLSRCWLARRHATTPGT